MRIRVVLGEPVDRRVDAQVRVVKRLRPGPTRVTCCDGQTVIEVEGPTFSLRENREHLLAAAYRDVLSAADDIGVRVLAVPTELSYRPWPLEPAIRVALTTLDGSLTRVREVIVVTPTPAALERWSEALARRPRSR